MKSFILFMFMSAYGHMVCNDLIPNGHNIPNAGHQAKYSLKLNAFGEDFKNAGKQWTKELCEMDSNMDGVSNGVHLGDPFCEWTVGSKPFTSVNLTSPGGLHPEVAILVSHIEMAMCALIWVSIGLLTQDVNFHKYSMGLFIIFSDVSYFVAATSDPVGVHAYFSGVFMIAVQLLTFCVLMSYTRAQVVLGVACVIMFATVVFTGHITVKQMDPDNMPIDAVMSICEIVLCAVVCSTFFIKLAT